MPKLFALFVSVNEYANPAHNLFGCGNDRKEMNRFFERYCIAQSMEFIPKNLSNAEATRQGLIDGFKHFKAAVDGDICVFYFSGHGSQSVAPSEIETNPNGMNESLVCHDSRVDNGRDLMDKELGYLVWKANQGKDIHFTSIVDSCHSGSATRSLNLENQKSRNVPPNYTPVSAKDYLGFEEYEEVKGKFKPKTAKHIHLGACRDSERAKEQKLEGQQRGVFTYSFLDTMQTGGVFQSYEEVMQRIRIKVQQLAVQQHPQLETPGGSDAHQSFLGIETEDKGIPYLVYFDEDKFDWMIDAGGMQGMEMSDDSEENTFIGDDGRIVEITEILINKSKVSGMDGKDESLVFPFWRKSVEAKALRVFFDQYVNKKDVDALTKQFEIHTNVKLVQEKEEAQYVIQIYSGEFILTRAGENIPVFKRTNPKDANAHAMFAKRVENVAAWEKILDIFNPVSKIPRSDIEIIVRVYDNAEDFEAGGFKEYKNPTDPVIIEGFTEDEAYDSWSGQTYEIEVHNKSKTRVYYLSGVGLTSDFSINFPSAQSKNIPLTPGSKELLSYTYEDGATYSQSVGAINNAYLTWGVFEISDHLKVFISTEEMQREFRIQPPLPLDIRKEKFSNLMGARPPKKKIIQDWIVFNVELKMKMTPPKKQVQAAEKVNVGNLQLKTPNNFSGAIGLGKLENFHGTNDKSLPPFYWTEERETALKTERKSVMQISNAFHQTDGMEVLEIEHANGQNGINTDNPLIISLENNILEEETIIPWGYDPVTGQYFPVGTLGKEGQIEINTLPPEMMNKGDKSLGGSIKIFFQKLIKKDKSEYPLLQLCKVSPKQELDYITKDAAAINTVISKENEPKKIALFIHGIIGDTLEMVKMVERVNLPNGEKLNTYYDILLSFDYENLGTVITDTAQDLKARLEAVGIKEGHPHTLHIYAHSMGGLVSRYMIEENGGDKFVNRLFQFGTPNGGSEWSDIRDMVAVLLPIVVGKIAFLQPYLSPLAFAGKYLDKATLTLKGMNAKSEIIKNLNAGEASSIPYTLINGNTQLVKNDLPVSGNFLKRIWGRLKDKPHYKILDAAIFHKPNDICVSIESQQTLRKGADFTTKVVGTDHISYFVDEASLKGFEEVLEELEF